MPRYYEAKLKGCPQAESPETLEKLQAVEASSQDAEFYHNIASDVPMEIMSELTRNGDRQCMTETTTELYEWLSLVRLGSPRTMHGNSIDPYLSRYKPPAEQSGPVNICCVRWTGLINAAWSSSLLTDLLAHCPPGSWFALSATEIAASEMGGGNETTVLRLPTAAQQFMVWEIKRRG